MQKKERPPVEDLPLYLERADQATASERFNQQVKTTMGVDQLLELLKTNRDRVGAYAIIVKGRDHASLVDPESGDTMRGFTLFRADDRDGLMVIQVHASDLVAEMESARRFPLMDLFR